MNTWICVFFFVSLCAAFRCFWSSRCSLCKKRLLWERGWVNSNSKTHSDDLSVSWPIYIYIHIYTFYTMSYRHVLISQEFDIFHVVIPRSVKPARCAGSLGLLGPCRPVECHWDAGFEKSIGCSLAWTITNL
jgi:hypothetical protein